MMKSIFYVLAAAVSALTMTVADDKALQRTGKDFEQHFLTKTPHHHQQAIEMAQLCGSKAANADVKAFCAKVMVSQQKEKEQMDTWRQSWYRGQGSVPPAEMQEMEAKHKKHMAELQSGTGGNFDHTFLTSMTEHHRDGLPEK